MPSINDTDDTSDIRRPPNPGALYRTIYELLIQHQKNLDEAAAAASASMALMKQEQLDATNTNSTNDDHDDGFVDDSMPLIRGIRRTPASLDFNRKRKYASVKFQLPEKHQENDDSNDEHNGALTEIIEECEYDSDIGKFKCKDDDAIEQDESENSSTSSMVDNYLQVEHLNNLNSPPKYVNNKSGLDMNNIVDESNDNEPHYKIVMKRIEFFETNGVKHCENEKITNTINNNDDTKEIRVPTREEHFLSMILLIIFILTVTLLIIFPLPNY